MKHILYYMGPLTQGGEQAPPQKKIIQVLREAFKRKNRKYIGP